MMEQTQNVIVNDVEVKQGKKGEYAIVRTDNGTFMCFDKPIFSTLKQGDNLSAKYVEKGEYKHIKGVEQLDKAIQEVPANPAEISPMPAPIPVLAPVADRELLIIRQCCLKAACAIPDMDKKEIIPIANRMVEWVKTGK